jgi:hypothetical protein
MLQPTPPFVKDYFYDFQAARQARAGAGAMSQFTPEQMRAFYRGFMLFTRQEIAKFSNATDQSLTTGLIQIDDLIGRNLTDILAQAEQGAGPFERSVSIDIAKRMQEPNYTYLDVYYHGHGSDVYWGSRSGRFCVHPAMFDREQVGIKRWECPKGFRLQDFSYIRTSTKDSIENLTRKPMR